jgi:hypothetical protein
MLKTAVVSGAVGVLQLTAAIAPPAAARMIDRVGQVCGEALVTAKMQQEDGKVLHRMNRTTDRNFAFDVWRYVPRSANQIDIRLSGPSGQECSIKLAAE